MLVVGVRPDGPARILVVDDSMIMRQQIVESLEFGGYDVGVAKDGASGLKLVQTRPVFDVLIFDLHMPQMDGLDLLEAVRQVDGYASTPALLLTAERGGPALERSRSLGVTTWLSKPCPESMLLRTVEYVLEQESNQAG